MTRRTATAGLAATLLAAALLLYVLMVAGALTFPGDRWAAQRIRHLDLSPGARLVTDVFGLLACAPVAAVTVLGLCLLVRERVSAQAAWTLFAAAAAPVVTSTWKRVLGPIPLDRGTFPAGEGSYPSGHVAYAVGLGGFVAVLCWGLRRRGLAAVAVVFVAAMGPMRVWGGQHLVSDVIGGYLVGLAWLLGVLVVARA